MDENEAWQPNFCGPSEGEESTRRISDILPEVASNESQD